jgi:hypothetical protein
VARGTSVAVAGLRQPMGKGAKAALKRTIAMIKAPKVQIISDHIGARKARCSHGFTV